MKPSEVRSELIAQHARLRSLILRAREVADRCARTQATNELHDTLAEIADAVRMHNLCEEALLRDVFPTLDGWGPVRAEVMNDEHVAEHRQVYEALLVASTTADAAVAAGKAHELFDRMFSHMEREERVLLAEDVLSDEELPPDEFGG